ncbi:MAG: quinolinate synthase NadA [Lachnospiraceae bacterium]
MKDLKEQIQELKKERQAVILAHYYVRDEVQEIADYVGDSYYLAKVAASLTNQVIVFCGVAFMGESAKILNPEKTVLMPVAEADCAMAHMVSIEKIQQMRRDDPDICVVTYINSTAETKMYSDVCVTSSNAVKIVKALPNKRIFFVPDENLGRYVSQQVPEKEIILNDGFCPVHHELNAEDVKRVRKAYPGVKILAHPECRQDVLEKADYIGSTSGIINYATECTDQEFIIATEFGVLYELQSKNPDKQFHPLREGMICGDMKLTTLENVCEALKNMSPEVVVEEETSKKAKLALEKMLELAK